MSTTATNSKPPTVPSTRTHSKPPTVRWYIAAAIVIIALVTGGFGFMISGLFPSESYELVLGLIIILGASMLTVLLFIMSAAFSSLGLGDPNQALERRSSSQAT